MCIKELSIGLGTYLHSKRLLFGYLRTGTTFYPDFIAELVDGSIFVLEYKGAHIDTAEDALIKNDVGKQWAKNSDGKRIFLMANAQDKTGRSLEEQINQAIG